MYLALELWRRFCVLLHCWLCARAFAAADSVRLIYELTMDASLLLCRATAGRPARDSSCPPAPNGHQ